jgi:hypothetical protein
MAIDITPVRLRSARRCEGLIARHPLSTYFGIVLSSVWGVLLPVVLARDGLGLRPFTVSDVTFVLLFIRGTILGPTAGVFPLGERRSISC